MQNELALCGFLVSVSTLLSILLLYLSHEPPPPRASGGGWQVWDGPLEFEARIAEAPPSVRAGRTLALPSMDEVHEEELPLLPVPSITGTIAGLKALYKLLQEVINDCSLMSSSDSKTAPLSTERRHIASRHTNSTGRQQ